MVFREDGRMKRTVKRFRRDAMPAPAQSEGNDSGRRRLCQSDKPRPSAKTWR